MLFFQELVYVKFSIYINNYAVVSVGCIYSQVSDVSDETNK
jgi:hypothetical protein